MNKQKLWLLGGGALVCVLMLVLIFLLANGYGSSLDTNSADYVTFFEHSSAPQSVRVQNEDSFTLSKSNDEWQIDSLDQIPLNESYCDALWRAAQSMTASSVFSPKEPLKNYGLEVPGAIITVQFEDQTTTLEVGNQDPTQTGYYCTIDGGNSIALVPTSSAAVLLRTQKDYASLTLMPYSGKTIDDEGNWVGGGATQCTLARSDLAEPITAVADENCKMQIVSPQGWSMDENTQTQLENAAFSLTAQELYAAHPGDEMLEQCGLQSPQASISYDIDGTTYQLLVGNQASSKQYSHTEPDDEHDSSTDTVSTSYYVKMQSAPAIYTIDSSELPWLTMQFTHP